MRVAVTVTVAGSGSSGRGRSGLGISVVYAKDYGNYVNLVDSLIDSSTSR